MQNREVIDEYVRLVYSERNVAAAFEAHVAEDYIQHNPMLPDGREAAVTLLSSLFGTDGATFDVQRVIVDGDFAVLHVRASIPGRPVLAVVDIYRLSGGKLAEHWDVIQPVPDESVNPHPMF